MICCGYCKMRLSRCQCPKAKPKEKRRKTKPAFVEPAEGQSTIHLIGGSPRVQLRWWGQNPQHQSSQDRRQSASGDEQDLNVDEEK